MSGFNVNNGYLLIPVDDVGFAASGAGPCLLIPRHQCVSECLEAHSFHKELVLAPASHTPAVAVGSISGLNLGRGYGRTIEVCWR